jgi:sugar phosphate isomerase/epimerase
MPADLSRLCLHTITTKPWPLAEAVRRYAAAGVRGITVWRDAIAGGDAGAAGRLIRDHGLVPVSLCRGGFFAASSAEARARAIDDNRRCLDEAKALGAPMIVLVCGAVPGQPLTVSRGQIRDAIASILPDAAAAGIKLAIEPLHPMYAAERSAVNTVSQARSICRELRSNWLGVAIDVFHVWWDDRLEAEIAACGREGTRFAFHLCDWKPAMTDLLNDRGLLGEGCIPIAEIRAWVERAGFEGFHEVEIFSERHWAGDQGRFLEQIKEAYLQHG